MIAFENVSKTYAARGASGEVSALKAINLTVPKGEIVGIIGRSGAGKSTLIRLINALDVPSSGVVRVRGTDIAGLSDKQLRQARRSIGMIFQHFNLLSSRTAFDNIALPLEIAGTPKKDIPGIVEPLLEMVGLSDKRDRYPAELSGGQKQRVGIARALATKPDVLLSDEATSALDPETTDQILDLLKRINAELNVTIVFITHEMDVVKKLADRVAVIDGGEIVEQGTAYEIFTQPEHPTTKTFVSTVTGKAVPKHLADALRPNYTDGSSTLLYLTFVGLHASDPILTTVARNLNIDIGIVAGQIETISGHPFGTLIVSVTAPPDRVDVVIAELSANNTRVERLGYVA